MVSKKASIRFTGIDQWNRRAHRWQFPRSAQTKTASANVVEFYPLTHSYYDRLLVKPLNVSALLPSDIAADHSAVGLFYPEIYVEATPNWTAQTIGQDAIDLFLIFPVLVISTLYAANGDRLPLSIWAGTNIYIVYTFVIYCLDVKFNSLFLLYCFILGLSSFSSALFLYNTVKDTALVQVTSTVRKLVGYFFIVLSVLFYFTWLSDIVPAIIAGEVPAGVTATGLITNPVHVLDLSIVLPLVFIVGILCLKGNSLALSLAAPLLSFFTLMDITIAVLALVLYRTGVESTFTIAYVMGGHALLSIGTIVLLWRNIDFFQTARVWNFN